MKRLNLSDFKTKPSIEAQDVSTLLGQVLGDCHTSERRNSDGERMVIEYDDNGNTISVTTYHRDGRVSVVD